MDKIFNIILEWFIKFWKSKFCDVIKLTALWGVVVAFIGGLFHIDQIICLGLGMCLGFVLILLLIWLFVIVVIVYEVFHTLLSYTERVLFDKNRFFK